MTLARLGRDDEALETCERAIQVEHGATSAQSTLGFVHLQAGRREAAREAFRLALARSIDNDYALSMLLDSCASREELDEALAYIHTQLVQQVNFGDGWLTYAYQARALLDDAALLEQLQAALERQPDTWQLWVVTARQLAFLERTDEADALLARAQERFSQMPRLGLERALLLRDQGRYAECRETLRDSLRINPLWTQSVRLYVETLVEEGTGLDEAEAMLRGVLQRTPDNTDLRAWLGYVLGERGEMAAGADEAERVLLDEPGNGWAWNQLRRYSAALDQPERPLALARSLVERRAGDSDAWLALAEQESTDEAREQALRRALQLTPGTGAPTTSWPACCWKAAARTSWMPCSRRPAGVARHRWNWRSTAPACACATTTVRAPRPNSTHCCGCTRMPTTAGASWPTCTTTAATPRPTWPPPTRWSAWNRARPSPMASVAMPC